MKPAIKAVRIVHGSVTEYNAEDCKILNTVIALIIEHGGISAERLQGITGYWDRTISWALWHIDAVYTPAQLWILPG